MTVIKKYYKIGDQCHYTGKYRGATHVCNLRYKLSKEIPVVFHNGSKYDYHFKIKELPEESKGQFECLGVNTEKYTAFSVSTKKLENNKIITYKIKSIESFQIPVTLIIKSC